MKAIYLDDRLHQRLKVLAARRGRPLKAVVEDLLDRAVSETATPDISAKDVQALAAQGGSFDFLDDPREDQYTIEDGEPVE